MRVLVFLRERGLLWVVVFVALSGCAHQDRTVADGAAGLRQAFQGLSPEVDCREADWLAEEAYRVSLELRAEYGVAGVGAWFDNLLVRARVQRRGLCWHWSEDLLARLCRRPLRTLELRRVVAREGSLFEHHALAVTARGHPIFQAIVLDAWRGSGRLHWGPLAEEKLEWRPEE